MHRTSTAQDLRGDLRDLRDAVAPHLESAVHTVAERTPPLIDKGRAIALEKSSIALERSGHAAEALARRIPDQVTDRLPDSVADRLPQPRHRVRKTLLTLAAVGLVGAAAAIAARSLQGSGAPPRTAPTPYPRPVEADVDPSDPLVEPRADL